MAHAGIRGYLRLDSGAVPAVPTEVSNWLDGITPSSDTDELDGTTFQPGVAQPTKDIIPGFRTRGLSLSVKWNEAAEAFFSELEGKSGLNYDYGPLGKDVGMLGITGLCNCLSWTGPVTTVDGIITGTAELRVSTRDVGQFAAGGDVTVTLSAAKKAHRQALLDAAAVVNEAADGELPRTSRKKK